MLIGSCGCVYTDFHEKCIIPHLLSFQDFFQGDNHVFEHIIRRYALKDMDLRRNGFKSNLVQEYKSLVGSHEGLGFLPR